MIKKQLLFAILLTLFQYAQAQEEIVRWTFPNNLVTDSIQNGTNALNVGRVLRVEGAGPVTMKNGATDYAAQAANWDNGLDTKNWNIRFLTTGYDHVQISSKQQGGGTNGGPKDFKLQYKVTSTGTWNDIPGGNVTLANDWTTGVISNLDLPEECQNQSNLVYIRWIMTSNTDIKGGLVTAGGISKIDDIIVKGMPITGLADHRSAKELSTYPNPSSTSFSIALAKETTLLEIYNTKGQLVFKTIPDKSIVNINELFPPGLYFIKSTRNGITKFIKHIVN